MLDSKSLDTESLAWEKMDGLIPAIVQDAFDGRVLMQAWMNRDALARTLECGRATFWSRSRGSLWTKGETSGNFLALVDILPDCDRDCLLLRVRPAGPACHRGTETCFDDKTSARPELAFLAHLERVIAQRDQERPEGSYTTRLLEAGVKRIAQKVGEEAVETVLAAAAGDQQELLQESADLLYHLMVLLRSRGQDLSGLLEVMQERHGRTE